MQRVLINPRMDGLYMTRAIDARYRAAQPEPQLEPRLDPILHKVIEEALGAGEEVCEYGHLKIVDVPDDVEWYLDQDEVYGECIHEYHRTWS